MSYRLIYREKGKRHYRDKCLLDIDNSNQHFRMEPGTKEKLMEVDIPKEVDVEDLVPGV